MRKVSAIVCIGLFLAPGVVYAQDNAVKKESEKFQGTWRLVSSEEDAQPTADFIVENLKIVIKGNQVSLKDVEAIVKQFGKVTITIDPSTNPKIIDFKIVAGTEKDKTFEGIYEMKDDRLKICVSNRSGGNRPDDFKTAAGSNRLLVVLKREGK